MNAGKRSWYPFSASQGSAVGENSTYRLAEPTQVDYRSAGFRYRINILMKTTLETRKCNSCGRDRPIDEFHRDRTKSDGYKRQCRECRAVSRTAYVERKTAAAQRVAAERDHVAMAKRAALKILVERHEREFMQIANDQLRRLNGPKTWKSLA